MNTESEKLAEIITKAREKCANDPRPRLGFQILANAERDRSAALRNRAAESPAHEFAQAWAMNSRIAADASIELQALADAMPEPPAPLPGRVHPPHDWDTWKACGRGDEPTEYQAHVIEAMAEALAAGLFYNKETGPRAAAILADRWGYPDAREGATVEADFGIVRHVGTHCYCAHEVIRARQRRADLLEATKALKCGPIAGRVITGNRENITSAAIVAISDTGETVEIQGKRGRAVVTWKPTARQAIEAIERGREWAEKHARAKSAPALA